MKSAAAPPRISAIAVMVERQPFSIDLGVGGRVRIAV
jgi:hypothetical protein